MAQMAGFRPEMFETGVPNLDEVLGGGLQRHNSYMIAGAPGTGKTVLTQQIAFHRAKQGERVLLVTGLAEPHRNLLEHLSTLHFSDSKLIGPQIETVSMVPFLERPVSEKIDVLRKTVLNMRPRLVVMESLRGQEAFAGGPMGMYQFVYGLTSWFALEGITLLLTKDLGPAHPLGDLEFSLVDGVLILRHDLEDGQAVRRLWVQKIRGQEPLEGMHTFELGANGITVWPRPQVQPSKEGKPFGEQQATFGIPGLDAMLLGGVREGTATLLAGDPGTGKTMAALAFLGEGTRQGRPGLWLGFRENRSRLLDVGWPWKGSLEEAEARGLMRFVTPVPLGLDANRLAGLLRENVAATGARRLVLDAVEAVEDAFPSRRSAESFQLWLSEWLAQEGISSLITQRSPVREGALFDVSDTPLAYTAENVIVFRHVERNGQLHRVLAILRTTGSGHDPAIREFTLDPGGITVGEPLPGEAGEPAGFRS